jgi:hypothetical protein
LMTPQDRDYLRMRYEEDAEHARDTPRHSNGSDDGADRRPARFRSRAK